MATYLLLDGHSLAFRAWFALQETGMSTASGQQTQAVYGFISMMTKLIEDFRPDGIGVAFDRSEPTFRDEIVPDYKEGRPPTPAPLTEQFGLIRQFVKALGVPAIDAVGFEADDVLGTLATTIAESGNDVIVVTGDRDAYQLVADPHIKVLYNLRGVTDYALYDEQGILARTGVMPRDYPLYAAMRGDKSDNIPGVPGVGEKTAAKLVNDYGDIDSIFANVDKCTPKLRVALADNEAQVRKNILLTPIVCDVPLDVTLSDLSFGQANLPELVGLLDLLEMRALKDRLLALISATDGAGEEAEIVPAKPLVVLDSVSDVMRFVKELEGSPDGATIGIDAMWAGAPGRSAIRALALGGEHADSVGVIEGVLLEEPEVTASLCSLVGTTAIGSHRLMATRVKELMRTLLPLGVDIKDLEIDTAVAAYLVDPASGQETLENIARHWGLHLPGRATSNDGEQLGFALDGTVDDDPLQILGARTETIVALGEVLSNEIDAIGATELWEEIERPLIRVLAKMEVVGIGVDVPQLEEINTELTAECRRLEAEIHGFAGEPFNVNSPTQLRVVLFDNLGLRPSKKTKTGYSTDAATLEKLRDQHPIIEALLSYREVEKLRSTYGGGLLAEVAPDGRIHASFNQTVARTGRLSSDAPNLHNIPVRSEEGRRFRKAFIPTEGYSFLVADYNQIELRVIAHLSGDPGLVSAFADGQDIHTTTAAGVFGVTIDEITPQMRAKAKMVSYGLAYGMEAYGLSQRLSIGVDEASQILDRYFIAFPSVRSYMEDTVAEAKRRGYTQTERGRRRYLPELSSSNFRVRQAAERQAMNAGIQGLAADIFKAALVNLDRAFEEAGLESRIVLQVHDEIIVEAPSAEHDRAHELTLQAMNNAYPLDVPLEVNIAWGTSWADAKSG